MRIKLGDILKGARKNRCLTQAEISDEFITSSYLSKIENNKNSLTFENLIIICNKLDLTIEEVVILMGMNNNSKSLKLTKNAYKFYKNNNLNLLKILYRETEHKFREHNSKNNKMNFLMLKGYIYELMDMKLDEKDIAVFLDHFFTIEFWDYYNLYLLMSVISHLDFNIGYNLIKKILEYVLIYKDETNYIRIYIDIIIKFSFIALENNKIDISANLLNCIEEYLANDTYIYQKLIADFLKGCLLIDKEDYKGVLIANKSIEILENLGYKEASIKLKSHLKKLIFNKEGAESHSI